MCLYAGIISFFIMLCFILTGAFVSTWLPPDVPPQKTLHYLLLHIPPLFKGVLCICLLALTMSTADSRLHICAVMISNDLLPVLFSARFRKNISCTDHYRIAYISILFIATLAIIVSLNSLYFSIVRGMVNRLHAFYMPIVVAPFILAVLGLRTSSYTVLIGMVAGTLAVFGWRKWMYPLLLTDRSTFPCILTNGLVMLAVHYVGPQPKHIKNLGSLLATLAKKIKPAFIRRYPLR